MDVPTGEFRALTDQVAELEARIIELSRATAFGVTTLGDIMADPIYREVCARMIKRSQPRHLHSVGDDAS